MKLFYCTRMALLSVCLFLTALPVRAQNQAVTLDFKDAPVNMVLESIEKQTKKSFFYEDNLINLKEKVSISVVNTDLKSVIEKLFSNKITCSVTEQHIVLQKAQTAGAAASAPEPASTKTENRVAIPAEKMTTAGTTTLQGSRTVRGIVTDETGETLPGALIFVKGNNKKNTTTNIDGKFELTDIDAKATLTVSFLGYNTVEFPLNGRTAVSITIQSNSEKLSEVVVIGNIERKRESFTGATAMVTGSELKQVGTQNLVQNLKSLDPSFNVLDNNLVGADPNAMPNIEIRGQTSINITDVEDRYKTDPNQPLFILNGFETSLQKIIDLDFNRVSSVTILKDAASTAMYGSRAANGVVVVETIKGQPGRYKLFYTGDFSVQIPDLTSYNMMNAEEKLQFELLSGRYSYNNTGIVENGAEALIQAQLDALYYKRLAEIRRGVDTYWMSDPVRTAFINRQSVRVSGGSEEMTIDAALSFRNAPGVMKGSKREAWSGSINLGYNKGQFSILNYLDVSGYTATDSPYGSFNNYVQTNPYYRKTDETGEYPRYLEHVKSNGASASNSQDIVNPLYNAMLNSKSQTSNLSVENNFQALWRFYQGMQLQGSFKIGTEKTNAISFIPPEHTQYDNVDATLRGNYRNSNYDRFVYQGRLMYAWMNTIKRHNYTINLQGELEGNEYTDIAAEAVGFPYGTNGNPVFATSYLPDGKPTYYSGTFRRVNLLASANYSYDNRYLFDASYRLDGSTAFGSDERYAPFWGVGIGWNVHQEKFMKPVKWLSTLRLRANMGETGNQNISTVVSTNIYTYIPGANKFGTSTILSQVGNPNMQWEKTRTTSLNLDLNLWEDRFVSQFSIYQKYTSPQIVDVDQAPSTGVSSYAMNMGNLTTNGFEFNLSYAIIRNIQQRINWNIKLFGTMYESTFDGFSGQLEKMNVTAQNSNSLNRYRDGYSPFDIWAVRSLGIDPATGQEVFLTKDNQPTFVYNSADETVVGNTNPDIYGTISSALQIKQFSFNIILRYSLGGDIFNRALYERVENISFANVVYNQDKRALYERWQNPGDVARFKAISLTESTPISSRFVQTENYLSGESISAGWRFDKSTWVRYLAMDQLNLSVSMNNFFRLSNVKTERGTIYPFARTISLSINAVF